ncbi:hypothetical protein PG994_000607 [Apiospora phragmitis]|uniref:Uncharacterized protein n=1 Tax=Apiospora phragmitis TaxID=2905665 RepID=A0ABR1X6V6_9PEZI
MEQCAYVRLTNDPSSRGPCAADDVASSTTEPESTGSPTGTSDVPANQSASRRRADLDLVVGMVGVTTAAMAILLSLVSI